MKAHTHRLKKHKYKTGNIIFFCTLPDCHYKIESALALGKKSICNICFNEFVLDEYSIKLVRPHCRDCGKQKVKDKDGKTHYVHKIANRIITSIAADSTKDLRERLENAIVVHAEDDV